MVRLRNHEKQILKNKNVMNFASLTAVAGTVTTLTSTTANLTTANITSAVVNSGSFGVLRVPLNKNVALTGNFWVSGGGNYFFVRTRGVVKSGNLK